MRLVITLLGAALTLTACGNAGTSATTGDDSTGSSAPNGTPSPSTSILSAVPVSSLTSAQLRKQLLTIDDLPPGYSADKITNADRSDKATQYFCHYRATRAQSLASQSFTKEQGLASSLFQTGIRRFSSEAQATGQMELLKKTMQTCRGETTEGEKVTYSVISAPDLGSDHIGIRIGFKEGTDTEYFIRTGPDLIQVAMGGSALSDQTINQLTDLATKQLAKVKNP